MGDSTVFRDLALYLEREATRLRGLGYPEWAGHLLEDADRLLEHAKALAKAEPPLPSAASLAGIDPEFKPAESELERLRKREATLREALLGLLGSACIESTMREVVDAQDHAQAVLEQGEQP